MALKRKNPTSEDYKDKYIEEKFKGVYQHIDAIPTLINARFLTVDEQLDRIEDHAARTNGRVSKHDDEIKDLNKRVDDAMEWAHHVVDTRPSGCPSFENINKVSTRVEKLEGKLEDAMFFIRHPKLFIGIITGAVLIVLFTLFLNLHSVRSIKSQQDNILDVVESEK